MPATAITTLTAYMLILSLMRPSESDKRRTVNQTEWSAPSDTTLRQAVVNPVSGDIYVGAKNAVFQFDQNLHLLNTLTTGPLEDASDCFPPSWKAGCFGADDNKNLNDNYNQLLALNAAYHRLVVCGNLEAGSCKLCSTENVSQVIHDSAYLTKQATNRSRPIRDMLIVSREQASSSAGVVAPDYQGRTSLYVATFMKKHSNWKPPIISVRSLEPGNELFLISKPKLTNWITTTHTYRIKDGFSSGQFVYFTSYQRQQTILSRICTQDKQMANEVPNSYMEGSIQCQGSNYKFLISQAISKPNSALAAQLHIQDIDGIVAATFASSFNSAEDRVGGSSALCLFTVKSLEAHFKTKQLECFSGKGLKGIARDGSKENCHNTSGAWNSQLCSCPFEVGLELDHPISVDQIYQTNSSNQLLVSVAMTSSENVTMIYAATSDGKLLQLIVRTDANSTTPTVSHTTLKDFGGETEFKVFFGYNHFQIYLMSKQKVIKIGLEDDELESECSLYLNCKNCVTSSTNCGFCLFENKCTRKENCPMIGRERFWLRIEFRCVQLQSLTPLKSSVSQTTKVLVKVLNVPAVSKGSIICEFGRVGETIAKLQRTIGNSSTFLCESPADENVQLSTNGSTGIISVAPVLKYSLTGAILAKSLQTFVFYNCTVWRTCTGCVESSMTMPCEWCPDKHQCTDLKICSKGGSTKLDCHLFTAQTTDYYSSPTFTSLTTSSTAFVSQTPVQSSGKSPTTIVLGTVAGIAVLALAVATVLLIYSRRRIAHYNVNADNFTTCSSQQQSQTTFSVSIEDLDSQRSSSTNEIAAQERRDHVSSLPTFRSRTPGVVVRQHRASIHSKTSDGYQRPIDILNMIRARKGSVPDDGYDELRFHNH
eukprot:m.194997 g.194997  ORF g.194997 m.194997 type:complete len:879 (+) comp39515_c0_seq6:105-2741(+)